ncbi:hypothetical protein BpHYR1_052931, partial [Brachionus plicatilis]
SAALLTQKSKVKDLPYFTLNIKVIPQVQNLVYLGLPIGESEFVSNFIEENWMKVEKSFYSLYGLGCKPKISSPAIVGFLYKQFCQSFFRYHLDLLFIVKRAYGIKKFARFRAMLESVKVESIEQMYLKQKRQKPIVIFLSDLKRYQQHKDNIYLNSQLQKSLETNEINDLVLHLATMAQSKKDEWGQTWLFVPLANALSIWNDTWIDNELIFNFNNKNNNKLQQGGLRRRLTKEAVYGWCVPILNTWSVDGAAVPVVAEEQLYR